MVRIPQIDPLIMANVQLFLALWIFSLFLAEFAGPTEAKMFEALYASQSFGTDEGPPQPKIPKRQNFLLTREYRDWH